MLDDWLIKYETIFAVRSLRRDKQHKH